MVRTVPRLRVGIAVILTCGLLLTVLMGPSGAAVIDCNGNGEADTVDIEAGVSADCNGNAIPDECDGSPLGFSDVQDVSPVSDSPRVLAVGDLDGDGALDMVAGTLGSRTSTLAVLINRGDTTFDDPVEYTPPGSHDSGRNVYSLVTGDFDDDGDLDVATANSVVILMWFNQGDGALDSPVSYPVSGDGDARFVAAVDVHRDGYLDLVTANRKAHTISVRANQGDGSFDAPVDFAVGNSPASIATDDFNGDGRQDVATSNAGDFSILLNQGAGSFATAVSYPLPEPTRPALLAAGDLDGDGAPDLAAKTRDSIVVLRNSGDGTFEDVQTLLTPLPATSFGIGDLDGDGDLDMAFGTGAQRFVVKRNDGRGGFGVTVEFPLETSPHFLLPVDFDRDGDLDLGAALFEPTAVTVLWNREQTTAISGTQTIPLVNCDTIGERPNGDPRGCLPHSGNVADLDNDGDLEIVATANFPGKILVLRNDGDQTFVEIPSHPFGQNPMATAVGDLDDDGNIDVVTVDQWEHVLRVHRGQGDGTFVHPFATYAVGQSPLDAELADIDGDGDLDAVTANSSTGTVSVLFNQGDGTFETEQGVYRVGPRVKALVSCDLDGDEDVDIAVCGPPSEVWVLRNRGDGSFEDGVAYRVTGDPNHITYGDFDGDGSPDLVTANPDSDWGKARQDASCSLLLNKGDGTFGTARDVRFGRAPFSPLAVDFNGDGLTDLITGNFVAGEITATSTVSILLGQGDGTFRTPDHYAVGHEPRFVFPGDFDLDGDLDLVSTNRTGTSVTVLYSRLSEFEDVEYLHGICTPLDFHLLSAIPGGSGPIERFTKYTLPVRDDPTLLPTVFQDTKRFPLHRQFLSEVFPDRFPFLIPEVYDNLVGRRDTREYFVGTVSRIRAENGPLFGFSVFADFGDATERLSAVEVGAIFEKLRLSFQLEPFAYLPNSPDAIEVAESWQEPGFPIHLVDETGSTTAYEAYTRGVGFGRVRVLDALQFGAASQSGDLSFQDILILDFAPTDIEGVVGGVITAAIQNPGSHLTVRTARRGTPNAFLRSAVEDFVTLQGEFVRLEVKSAEYRVRPATLAEADAWWDANRPTLSELPTMDAEFGDFPGLLEIAAMDATAAGAGQPPIEARFGGKCSNLARLQGILDGPYSRYREKGFGIPLRYYLEFLRSNSIPSELHPGESVTYEQYLDELFGDIEFQSNSRFRFAALETLRGHMREHGEVDPALIERLLTRIDETFGFATTTRVRLRSSSNVEDAIEFNGAGLYDSTSGCPADQLDGNTFGPSLCNPSENKERTISRALKKVWASLWNFRAHEERAFFRIPQDLAAMGLLVNRTFIDEAANGVAFTGNPTNPFDRRYVVTVQEGENSVVSPAPGVLAEQDILELRDGEVVSIVRAVESSLVPPGTRILSDQDLNELGELLWHIDRNFPVDLGNYAREEILLDLEFKKLATGELAVKQVRPLLVTSSEPTPTFELEIPPGTLACGVFELSREPREELELKSMLRFAAGTIPLPSQTATFPAELFEEVVLGPNRQVAMPAAPGEFSMDRRAVGNGVTNYSFEYRQEFVLPGGDTLDVWVSKLDFRAREADPIDFRQVIDEAFLTDGIFLQATLVRGGEIEDISYASCAYTSLPLWEVRAVLDDGSALTLEERFRPEPENDFGPAALTRAKVTIGGVDRQVTSYWDLVYSARHHNESVRYWVVLAPPMTAPAVEEPVHALELVAPSELELVVIEAKARYLGENFEVLAEMGLRSFGRQEVTDQPEPFRRGDVNADGRLDISDAIVAVQNIFFRRLVFVDCDNALDANDDGALTVADPTWLLAWLFATGPALPSPFRECGIDDDRELGCAESNCLPGINR